MQTPVLRAAQLSRTRDQLSLSLSRGGKLEAQRVYPFVRLADALEDAQRWLEVGPALFTLDRLMHRG